MAFNHVCTRRCPHARRCHTTTHIMMNPKIDESNLCLILNGHMSSPKEIMSITTIHYDLIIATHDKKMHK